MLTVQVWFLFFSMVKTPLGSSTFTAWDRYNNHSCRLSNSVMTFRIQTSIDFYANLSNSKKLLWAFLHFILAIILYHPHVTLHLFTYLLRLTTLRCSTDTTLYIKIKTGNILLYIVYFFTKTTFIWLPYINRQNILGLNDLTTFICKCSV